MEDRTNDRGVPQNVTTTRAHHDYQLPEPRGLSRFRRRLLRWYDKNGRKFPWRKSSTNQYQAIVAELLLQRTRAETVADFFLDFILEFPSWNRLRIASVARLESCLRPIGLWRRRAASIRILALEMAKRGGLFPRDRAEIEALPGIGQYIANAVLLFCHGVPEPLLDLNMARVLERVFGPRKLADIRYDPYLQALAGKVVRCKTPTRLNWALLDLAATTCLTRNPRCNNCPLASMCLAAPLENRGTKIR